MMYVPHTHDLAYKGERRRTYLVNSSVNTAITKAFLQFIICQSLMKKTKSWLEQAANGGASYLRRRNLSHYVTYALLPQIGRPQVRYSW